MCTKGKIYDIMGKIGKIYEKGERLLKKIIAFCLAAVMVFAFFGCDETMTAAENFLLATKEWNMEQMKKELVPDTKTGALYTRLDTELTEEETLVLQKLYGMIQYTIGEESLEKGAKFVKITLKVPDFARIRELCATKILVLSESAETIISGMIEDGSIEKSLMTEKTVSVKMVETSGASLIPCDENSEFFEILYLSEMLSFISTN